MLGATHISEHDERFSHLYQEVALQKPFLDISCIPFLTFIQTRDPVVVADIVVVNAITDFGSDADEIERL